VALDARKIQFAEQFGGDAVDLKKVNLRGPSTIILEPYTCEICGKRRSRGHLKNQHVKCSKIKQRLYRERETK